LPWSAHGSLTFHSDGTFVYTPTAHFVGDDTFQYKGNDGIADGDPSTAHIHVTNYRPEGAADAYAVIHDRQLHASSVLNNDRDLDESDQVSIDNPPTTTDHGGELQFYPGGNFTYTPPTHF